MTTTPATMPSATAATPVTTTAAPAGPAFPDLHDILLPPPVSFWPPAPGWWLVGVLVMAVVLGLGMYWLRRRRRLAWYAPACRELEQLTLTVNPDSRWFAELSRLLKRVAQVKNPQGDHLALSGDDWANRLHQQTTKTSLTDWQALVRASWQPEADISPELALSLTRRWLEAQRQC